MGSAEAHRRHTSVKVLPCDRRLHSVVAAMTCRQVSRCWEASGYCYFFSRRGWQKILLHMLNAVSWWSLLKTEPRWKPVMQMCHITVALSLYSFVWYGRSTAIIFTCSLYCCRAVTWSIYCFICFMLHAKWDFTQCVIGTAVPRKESILTYTVL